MSLTELYFEKPKVAYSRRPFMRSWYWLMRLLFVPLQRSMAASIPIDNGALAARADDSSFVDSAPQILSERIIVNTEASYSTYTNTTTETSSNSFESPTLAAHENKSYKGSSSPTYGSPNYYYNTGPPAWVAGVVIAGIFALCLITIVVYYCFTGAPEFCTRRLKSRKKEDINAQSSTSISLDSTTTLGSNGIPTGNNRNGDNDNSYFSRRTGSRYIPYRQENAEPHLGYNNERLENWRAQTERDLQARAAAVEIMKGINPRASALPRPRFPPAIAVNDLDDAGNLGRGIDVTNSTPY